MKKMTWDGTKWDREVLFPANPDLADVLGDMDIDFENYHFGNFSGFKLSRFPGPQLSKSPDLQTPMLPLRRRKNSQIPT